MSAAFAQRQPLTNAKVEGMHYIETSIVATLFQAPEGCEFGKGKKLSQNIPPSSLSLNDV